MGESFELSVDDGALLQSMELPFGKRCIDCAFFKSHCEWLLSRQGDEAKCDWAPSRFQQK